MDAPRERRSLRLRSYLTALVLIPVLGMTVFAAFVVADRRAAAAAAQRVESLVGEVARLAAVESGVQNEVLPSLALSAITNPQLQLILGFTLPDDVTPASYAAIVDRLRARSDRALARLRSQPADAAFARRLTGMVRSMRADIDSGARIRDGFTTSLTAVSTVSRRAFGIVGDARSAGVEGTTAERLSDLEIVAAAAHQRSVEVPLIGVAVFGSLPSTSGTPNADAVRAWATSLETSARVGRDASPLVARLWHEADAPRFARVEQVAGRFARTGRFDFTALNAVFPLLVQRSDEAFGVVDRVAGLATEAAAARSAAASRAAWLAVGGIALLALLTVVGSIAVLRSIARPLGRLADRASEISEGTLATVEPEGPREVRTVAQGLSSAVASLRRVEAQADAVTNGEFESDIVREPLPGALGAVMHRSVSAMVAAIHDRDAAKRDLAHRATHDALTELPNRAQAMELMSHALQRAQRVGATTAVMFVDLDHFKAINDTYGHAAGDLVLQVCARRMAASVRGGDVVFRLGGDEFVVLLEDVESESDTVRLAERIIGALSEPIEHADLRLLVGASIGVAFSQDGGVDAERLLADADAAAYRAKKSGRACVGLFDDALRAALAERHELEAAITRGLAEDEFRLHYQPIIDLHDGRTVGMEALIRWERPGHGLVQPADFVPVAERSVLINELDRFALVEATSQLARWDAAGTMSPELTVSVNVSGRHLANPHLVDHVTSALTAAGVAASRLVVEVTETVLVDDPTATANMSRLRALGVQIAIDDFGTGYTSIGQIPRLPIDKIKIDRSFISSTDEAHIEVVRLIVAASHAFGLSVVAEGVEVTGQLDTLGAAGVDTGQGYLFARPRAAEDLVAAVGPEPHVAAAMGAAVGIAGSDTEVFAAPVVPDTVRPIRACSPEVSGH